MKHINKLTKAKRMQQLFCKHVHSIVWMENGINSAEGKVFVLHDCMKCDHAYVTLEYKKVK